MVLERITMKLSHNFTLKELIKSDTARRLNINNTPTEDEKTCLLFLVLYLLQPMRDAFGPTDVTSGYRCPELNLAIKGSKTSQHRFGQAADIRIPKALLTDVFNFIRDNLIFGQLIYEAPGGGREPWIHISLPRLGGKNQECLLWDGEGYTKIEGRL